MSIKDHLVGAKKLLLDATTALNKRDVPYHLEGGTLLGIYRNGQLLPWDKDLDISVPSSALDKIGWNFKLSMRLKGWRISVRHFRAPGPGWDEGDVRLIRVTRRRWLFFPGNPSLDIFVKYPKDGLTWWCAADTVMRVDSCHYEGSETVSFDGNLFQSPVDPDGYLTAKYGDWRTPVKNWDCARDELTSQGPLAQ